VPEPADRQPNPSDVHISDAEDSYSNSASPRGMQAASLNPNTPASNSSRCFSFCKSRWRTNKRRWSDYARQVLVKKMLRLMPRHDNSSKSGHCENRNLSLLRKEMRRLPCHHRVPGNPRIPLEAWGATGQTQGGILETQSIPGPRSSLA